MDLIEVRVNDFLAYREATLSLDAGLILLVGANNAGKSALVAALDVIAERGGRSSWTRAGSPRPARVAAVFELDDGERALVFGGDANSSWLASPAARRAEVVWEERHPGQMMFASASVITPDGAFREFVSFHQVDRNTVGIRAIPRGIFVNPPDQANWHQTEGSRTGPSAPARDELRGSLPGLGERLAAWQEWYYHFAAVRSGVRERGKVTNVVARLEPTGFNLGEALLFQQSRESVEWGRIREIVTELLPDAGKLLARVEADEVQVTFQDPALGTSLNVKQLGSGVEQALMAVYVGVTQPVGSVIVMEEPEAGLHPAAQRVLLRHIEEWSRTRQFLVTTHSSVFLDLADSASSRTFVVRRQDGQSSVEPSMAGDVEPWRELGVRLGDVASAECVLVVEGVSDAAIIRAWFPEALGSGRVAIVGATGGDSSWHTDVVVNVVAEADRLARRVLFVRDRDELTPEAVTSLEGSPNVRVLARRELENYLLEPQALHGVLAAIDGVEAPPASEIAERLALAADSLRPMVQIKMTAARVAPIRLFDRKDIRRLAADRAQLEDLVAHMRERVGDPAALEARVRDAWEESSSILEAEWEARKLELAPGTDVLEALWQGLGRRFRKDRDGPRIAAKLDHPPEEFVALISELMRELKP